MCVCEGEGEGEGEGEVSASILLLLVLFVVSKVRERATKLVETNSFCVEEE